MGLRAGFVGLGNLGRPIASRLAPAGFETTVFDIDPAPVRELVAGGARAAESPRELAARADVIGICVPRDEHVRSVLCGPDGLLEGAAPGSVVAIHSTVLPRTVEELAAAGAEKGVRVIDACVTGGDQRAAAGTLTYLVGGDAEAIEKARSFLEASAERIVRAGGLGDGARLKLAINVLTYIQWAAAYEAFSLARASGLDPAVFEEAGRANGQLTELQQRFLVSHKLPEEVAASDGFQKLVTGHLHTAEKDLAWALQLARESELSLPVTGLVSQLMARIYRVRDAGGRG